MRKKQCKWYIWVLVIHYLINNAVFPSSFPTSPCLCCLQPSRWCVRCVACSLTLWRCTRPTCKEPNTRLSKIKKFLINNPWCHHLYCTLNVFSATLHFNFPFKTFFNNKAPLSDFFLYLHWIRLILSPNLDFFLIKKKLLAAFSLCFGVPWLSYTLKGDG